MNRRKFFFGSGLLPFLPFVGKSEAVRSVEGNPSVPITSEDGDLDTKALFLKQKTPVSFGGWRAEQSGAVSSHSSTHHRIRIYLSRPVTGGDWHVRCTASASSISIDQGIVDAIWQTLKLNGEMRFENEGNGGYIRYRSPSAGRVIMGVFPEEGENLQDLLIKKILGILCAFERWK